MKILLAAYMLDLIFGDPQGYPHPVRFIGNFISYLEKKLLNLEKDSQQQLWMGALLTSIIVISSYVITFLIIKIGFYLNDYIGLIIAIILGYTVLATKSLDRETRKVYVELEKNDIPRARTALSYIVGRETKDLEEEEIVRATVETIGENIADGIIAPMFYFFLGGVPLAMAYKAVNTLDSMVAYKNDKYLYFGRVSAILDDIVNYIPARLTAIFIVMAAFLKGMDYKRAIKTIKLDRKNHESPNAGYPEAAVAGALNIQLGGVNKYFGREVHKPTIGEALKPLKKDDIITTIDLMYWTSMVAIVSFSIFKILMGDL